jgi:hypothetical protein
LTGWGGGQLQLLLTELTGVAIDATDVTYWWLVLNWCHLLVLTIVVGFSLAFAAPQHHAGSVSQCSIMLLRWGLMGRFVICIHPSIPR